MALTDLEQFAILYSLKVGFTSIVITLPFAVFVAALLVFSRWRGKIIVESVLMIPLVLPPVVTGYLILLLCGRGGIVGDVVSRWFGIEIAFAFPGSVLAASVVSFPLVLKPVIQAMESVDKELIASSRSLGAGPLKTFFKIILPLSRSGLLVGTILGFVRALGEFGATIMVTGNIPFKTTTIPLAIYGFFHQPHGDLSALRLVIIAILISLIALIAAQWYQFRGRSR